MKTIIIFILISMSSLFSKEYWESNWAIGPHLVISFPQDDFANVSKTGEGLGAKLLYKLSSTPNLVPRLDFAYISYGEKRGDANYFSYYTTVQTRNEAFQLVIGPQFQRKMGRLMPYVAAMGGLYNYRSVTSVSNAYAYYDPYGGYGYSDTKFSLTKFGWNVNGGIKIDVNLGPFIDLNIKYQTIRDGIKNEIEGEDGEKQTFIGDAKDFTFTLGVVFFLGDN